MDKNMNVLKWSLHVLAVGATMFTVGGLFYLFEPGSITVEYENKALFREWGGWTGTYMILHPFWYGLVFGTVYLLLLKRGCVAPGWRDSIIYGLVVFLVGSLPVFLIAYASFNVQLKVIIYWIIQNACQYLAAGLAVALVVRLSTRWAPRG
jgi:hypothetical protein